MSSLFLSDVDGTLIELVFKLNPRDVSAIKAWKDKGNLFGLVSGRDKVSCQRLLGNEGLEADCLITSNGALTYVKEECICSSLIDLERSKEIFQELLEYPFLDFFYTNEEGIHHFPIRYMGDERFEKVKQEQSYLEKFAQEDVFEYLDSRDTGCAKLSIWTHSEENTQKMLPILKERFSDVEVMRTSFDYIEITQKNTDKAMAYQQLMKKFPVDHVYYIGDSSNDVTLFRLLDNSFVMSQAMDSVKKEANYVVDNVKEAIEMAERMEDHV